MMSAGDVEPTGAVGEFGEGPLWDVQRSVLWWVDVFAGAVHCLDPSTGSDRAWRAGRFVASLTPRRDGTLLVCTSEGFTSLDPDSGATRLLVPLEPEIRSNRLNDAKVDSVGRFWAGTMDFDGAAGRGCLYRLDPDLSCTPVLPDVTISNGIGWSPDDWHMYYVDTPLHRIDMFDFDPVGGSIHNRRTLVDIPRRHGTPDGLTVDAEGHVWVALFGGGEVHRYSPDGRISGRIELPVSNVTSCTLGGPNLDDLFITTTALQLEPSQRGEQPLAGSVFRVRVSTPGPAPTVFAG